jgi:hypothetical protein
VAFRIVASYFFSISISPPDFGSKSVPRLKRPSASAMSVTDIVSIRSILAFKARINVVQCSGMPIGCLNEHARPAY